MPITIDIEKDYLYNLGLQKADELVKKAREVAFKAKKQVEQLAEEKAKLEAKIKIDLIKNMKSKGLTNGEILEFSNLDKDEFNEYLKVIEEDK